MNRTKSSFIVAVLATILASGVAFAGGSAETPADAGSAVSIAMQTPSVETNLFWVTAGDFNLDPAFQPLVGHDPETGVFDNSGLARNWEHNADFTRWTFHLHEDAEFHFGWGGVTAADVVHSHRLHTGDDAAASGVERLAVATVEAEGDYTVHFHLPNPEPEFLFAHGERGAMVVYSKAQYDAEGLAGYEQQPAGTGQFQYVSRANGQNVVFEKVENHWSGTDAMVDRITIRFIDEPATRLALLMSGEVDIATIAPDLQGTAVDAGKEVIASRNYATQTTWFLSSQFETDPVDENLPWLDIRIREAMARSIDTDAMNDVLYAGRADRIAVFGMHTGHEGYNEDLIRRFDADYGYDPDRARELMREAGYPDSFENPTIPILATTLAGSPEFGTMAEFIQDSFESVGFQTQIIEKTWSAYGADRRARAIDYTMPMRNQPIRPSQVSLQTYFTTLGRPVATYEESSFDETFVRYRDSADAEERDRLAAELFEHIFDNYISIPLASVPYELTVNPDVIAGWTFPGVSSAGLSHWHLIEPVQ